MVSGGVSERGFVDYLKCIPRTRRGLCLVLKRKDLIHTGFRCFFMQEDFIFWRVNVMLEAWILCSTFNCQQVTISHYVTWAYAIWFVMMNAYTLVFSVQPAYDVELHSPHHAFIN